MGTFSFKSQLLLTKGELRVEMEERDSLTYNANKINQGQDLCVKDCFACVETGWPQTSHVVKEDLELVVLLALLPEH